MLVTYTTNPRGSRFEIDVTAVLEARVLGCNLLPIFRVPANLIASTKKFSSTSRIFCYDVRAHYNRTATKPHGGLLVFNFSDKLDQRQQALQQRQHDICCDGISYITCFG